MFDCAPVVGYTTFTSNGAPDLIVVFADVLAASFGPNDSAAQLVAWNGFDSAALAPSVEPTVAPTAIAWQPVGLNANAERSTVTFTVRMSSGIPSRIVGNGLETT